LSHGRRVTTTEKGVTSVGTVPMTDLLDAGVHFGHQTRRWNPKMKKYIFMQRNGIHIIDLKKTLQMLDGAANALREVAATGKPVLFLGTKKQAQTVLADEAERAEQYHVTNRWLGGMLTNFQTIQKSVKQLDDLDAMAGDGTYALLSKKEVAGMERTRTRLEFNLGGIRRMKRLPGAMVVVDTRREDIGVAEAKKLKIPVFAVVDTNCDPEGVDFAIPGNDDAMRSVQVIIRALADAVIEGVQRTVDESKDSGDDGEEGSGRKRRRKRVVEASDVEESSEKAYSPQE